MSRDTHHQHSPTRGELLIIRWVVGLLGAAMLAGVVAELWTGSFSYALGERWGREFRVSGHETTRSAAGLLFAFGSFGLMGLGSVAFALRPRLFANEAVVWAVVAVILVSFVGLRLAN